MTFTVVCKRGGNCVFNMITQFNETIMLDFIIYHDHMICFKKYFKKDVLMKVKYNMTDFNLKAWDEWLEMYKMKKIGHQVAYDLIVYNSFRYLKRNLKCWSEKEFIDKIKLFKKKEMYDWLKVYTKLREPINNALYFIMFLNLKSWVFEI
jgi:hypothetical protein